MTTVNKESTSVEPVVNSLSKKSTVPYKEQSPQQLTSIPYYGYNYYSGPHSNTTGPPMNFPMPLIPSYPPGTCGEYISSPYMMHDGSMMYPSTVKMYPDSAYMYEYPLVPDPAYYGPNAAYYAPGGMPPVPPSHISYRDTYDQAPTYPLPSYSLPDAVGGPQTAVSNNGKDNDIHGSELAAAGRYFPNGFDYYADDGLLFRDYNSTHAQSSDDSSGNRSSKISGDNGNSTHSESTVGHGVSNYFNSLLYGPGPPIVTSSEPSNIKGPPGSNLFCFHLPNEITNWDLYLLFRRFGTILSVHTMVNRQTGLSRGYGFISYESPDAAERAIEHMNGFRLGKKRLKVQRKRDQEQEYGQQQNLQKHKVKVGELSVEALDLDLGEDLDLDLDLDLPPISAPAQQSKTNTEPEHQPRQLTRREPCNPVPTTATSIGTTTDRAQAA